MKMVQRVGCCRAWMALRNVVMLMLIVAAGETRLRGATIDLGTADSFAVLASATITNTGPTVVSGDIGVHPGTAIVGFFGTIENDGPGNFVGASHQGNAVAGMALNDPGGPDANDAYVTLAGLAFDASLGAELGGQLLTAGVYNISSAAQLTGTLTLDGPGQYVFQIGSALTTASDSVVSLINGASACGIWFVMGSAATLGTDTEFNGNLITLTEAITLNTGATIDGRLISLGAAVNLDSNIVTVPICATVGAPGVEVTDDGGNPVIDGGPSTIINGTDFGITFIEDLIDPTQIFTITNDGDSLLELGALDITGDFYLLGAFPISIAPGDSADFTIAMDNSTLGNKTGTASFTTNTPDSPFTFDLSGLVVIGNVAGGIPEPATASLAMLSVVGLMMRRRLAT